MMMISSFGAKLYDADVRERLVPALLIHHPNRTVGSFSETEVSIKFCFRKRGQLQLLFNNLRVPKFFRFIDDNGKSHRRVRGEEAFLIGLARLSSQHLPILFRILSCLFSSLRASLTYCVEDPTISPSSL